MVEPDPHLVASARAGDLEAFGELVRRCQPDAWRLALHLVRDPALADDVTQEAFVRAYRFLPRWRGEARFSTWLFAITRNCARDEIRRAERRRRLGRDLDALRPRAAAAAQVAAVEVREALEQLPLDLREPVVLIDMLGVSYGEAAAIVGAPVGTIKSRVHRARALLAIALRPDLEEARGG